MRNKLVVSGIIVSLLAGPAMAGGASKEEKVGVGTGATIGAIAAGPVGLIIGAAIGAKIGDGFHSRNEQLDSLSNDLTGSRQYVADLERNIDELNGNLDEVGVELEQLQNVTKPELLSLMTAGIEMDLLFRTDEDVLSDSTGMRLQQMASTLAAMPDVFVQLDGYADERGNAEYNRMLSARRAENVKTLLITNGVPESRIKVTAHGESPAVDTNVDSYALERKVSLTLYIENSTSFASNP